MRILNQQGALFGIDARIAMVVFAVLSVTIGTFTFSRIQTARDATLIKELQEIDKAVRELQTDTGTFYAFAMPKLEDRNDFAALWDENRLNLLYQSAWNGPYYTKEGNDHPFYGEFSLAYFPDNFNEQGTHTNNCYVWIKLTEVPQDVWKRVNAYVDENLGDYQEDAERAHILGKIRAENLITDPVTLYYRSASRTKE